MDEHDYKSLILYYGREKFYHLMQNMALEAMRKLSANITFRLYNGFALVLGNRIQEGIRELNPIRSEPEYSLASILALIYAHKRCTVIDKEALISFDAALKDERKKLTSSSAYYAAIFLLFSGKYEKSREYAEKALKLNGNLDDAVSLKGWAELNMNMKINKGTVELFDKVLASGKSIDANLGQVKYYQLNNDFETAISILNKLSVRYPELNIPLIEKMKTQLASWNWNHALETSVRILNLEPTNIEALRVKALVLICRDGNMRDGLKMLQDLFSSVGKVESTNCDLYVQIAQLFSRTCGRNRDILDCTTQFCEKAFQMSPGNANYVTELGYQSILLGRFKDATKYFRTATKLDDSSIFALCGLTLCQLSESGPSEQVKQQIEFLNEIQGTSKIPLLLFMSAKLETNNADKAIALLTEACEVHFKNLKTISYGPEYLKIFNPDFLLQVTTELLQYSPIQCSVTTGSILSKESLHISLKHCLNILEAIVKACPGLVRPVYLLAKVEFLCGDICASESTLQKILEDLDPSYTDAHLLITQIHIQQEQFLRAAQSLEVCLSHNFSVRESAMYHLLFGIIKKKQNHFDECIKSYITALNLSGLNKQLSPSKSKSMTKETAILSLADKATLHLEIVDIYTITNQSVEATKTMQLAMEEFKSTPEEGRIVIANADLALQKGNIIVAIDMLRSIEPGQPYYLQAKTKLANVYLHHKKDRLAFSQCFKELVENCPGAESYLMLGDAYMSIQEPEEAINAFRQALRQNPSDSLLASKLGRAYVKTHQYTKAISYYKDAILSAENSALKLDLAELFLKLKQFSNAEQILLDENEVGKLNEDDDLISLQSRTKQLLLLARIREKSGYLNSSLTTLKEARDNQHRLQKRISLDQSGGLQEQQKILSKICVLMAEQSINLRDTNQAVIHYKEALKHSPGDLIIMAAYARLCMQMNDMDECKNICAAIFKIDANNESASVMMADLSFRQMEFENAAYHFSQLLTAQPIYWTALARLIEVMRRSATLQEVNQFLVKAEQSCARPQEEAGLSYCKGLFEWYSGNPNAALRYFNNARRDLEWGKQSIFNMIEICLNPDGDLPNEGCIEAQEDMDMKDSRLMALRTAERLLTELRPRAGSLDNEALNHRLLKNFLSLATRQRSVVESALNDFTAIASQQEYKDHVGATLGMASAQILLKQSQRARNQLKRIKSNRWTFEDAEYLERCWLILADLYIQSAKYDYANELLCKVLEHNKSSCKAYELAALISEKESSYREAARNYSSAWRFGGRSKPSIGYKLAFNHMKNKCYADAIDVCQQVLKLHPDYPAIKKDILDKCRNYLKA